MTLQEFRRDLGVDTYEVTRDVLSISIRVICAYTVFTFMGIAFEVAMTTAVLVTGARIFDPQTNWFHRTRKNIVHVTIIQHFTINSITNVHPDDEN